MSKVPDDAEQLEERNRFYATVGKAISKWALMESEIVHFAADLLDTQVPKAGIVLYSINFTVWLLIIEELLLLDKRLASVKTHWGEIASDLRKLNDIRVRLAHHTVWQSKVVIRGIPPSLMPVREDQRKKSRGYAPLTATEIDKFTENTTAMFYKIQAVEERLRSARMRL